MKEIIKLKETNKVANSEKCVAYEYLFGSGKTSLALIEMKNRYPDRGFAINKVFEEIIFVLNGKGRITIDGKSYDLTKNDAVMLKPGKKYYYEGDIKVLTFTSPAFKVENHEVLNE
ncbi:MAG: AraC family ligand binding domain-containing protein [Candidatus Aenigmarchaeota archaeon]|nr:AraC family ligand binding domain-containing protein [Candidatus Aenigmarchaeota archaeon]